MALLHESLDARAGEIADACGEEMIQPRSGVACLGDEIKAGFANVAARGLALLPETRFSEQVSAA